MTPLSLPPQPLELWGGIECTVNRVGATYFDQIALSGHAARIQDLEAIAQLGIKTLRYPALWEKVAPHGVASADWSWTDERLKRLECLGMTPILGLVHHGSGPAYTDLLDPQFPEKLASYARAVAERYPWVERYTPVNEPLTTARFSGLYGHWYPHHRDDRSFVRALLNQCRGIQLAMAEIRAVNPAAQLIQTEDLGMTLSTPLLAYQAEFENHRRWLTYDLLSGQVDREHPLYSYLIEFGVSDRELGRMREEASPPHILGVNHYVTSVRFLDERVHMYPSSLIGRNGHHTYADVEAVRVCEEGGVMLQKLLIEAWSRYGIPIVVTEAHLGCLVCEEQILWLAEVWEAAAQSRKAGVDVRAVTAWSLLGAFDWHCLVTRPDGCYESGAFDVREDPPRATKLAGFIRELASSGDAASARLNKGRGWWRCPERLLYSPVTRLGNPPPQTLQDSLGFTVS